MTPDKKLRIFVVEDNIFIQQLIAKQLETISYAVHFFSSGEGCLEALHDTCPDLVVLDNHLDGALSGLETLKVIRMCQPELYVILFSSEQSLCSAENRVLYGDFDYVEKNINSFGILHKKIAVSKVFITKASPVQ